MWAIRRASAHLKNRVLGSGTSRVRYLNSEIESCCFGNCNAEIVEFQGKVLDALICSRRFCSKFVTSRTYPEARAFCSQAGAEHDYVFHMFQNQQDAAEEAASGDEVDDESIIEELEISDSEAGVGKDKPRKIRAPSGMTRAILADTRLPVSRVLEKWVEAGNEVTLAEVSVNILYFRKRRMFSQALQLSEWLHSSELTEPTESNYASLVDLIAKVRGIIEAEKYVHQIIPKSLRTEVVYRTLLAACVTAVDVKKAEELFNKMKDAFPISCFSCDQLLLLYKRTNRNKITDVLSFMKKENIKRSIFTYQILIHAKWQSGHISGVEQLLEEMKSDGLEPNMHILASVAKYYVDSGLKVKAEAMLKHMEGRNLGENRWACRFLLPIYGSLGRADEVKRIWKECESDPDMAECIAGIQAWGRLNRIEEAEAVFDKLLRVVRRPSSRHYALMLNMYADHKLLDKGEELVRRMNENGVTVTPPAQHALLKLYARSGEVGKAESLLSKALGGRRGMHLLGSFMSILDAYAGKGDVENAERIFLKMKRAGFTSSGRPYRSLLYAYVNAKAPAYGLRERMKVDNVIPDRKLASLLARASKFTRAPPAELVPKGEMDGFGVK